MLVIRLQRGLVLAVFAWLTGCSTVRDLHLVKLAIVDRIPPTIEASSERIYEGKILEMTLSTSTNVRNAAMKFGLHVRTAVYVCGDKKNELSGTPYAFDDEGIILDVVDPSRASGGSSVRIYVEGKAGVRRPVESGRPDLPAYDLSMEPRDLCVQVHGRNMALLGFSSNVVVIPARRITEALATTP